MRPSGAEVRTLTEAVIGETKPILVVLTAAVALLLLIACANVGNLLLLRAALRMPEIVIRRSLGASAGQVARLVLVESALLGTAGGILGLAGAVGLLRLFLSAAPAQLPRADLIGLEGVPVALAVGLTLLSLVLFGVLPAIAAVRGNLTAIRLDLRGGTQTKKRRFVRQVLVASQVALAVTMLAGAGLLLRSLHRLNQVALGYDVDHLAIVSLAVPFVKFDSDVKLFAMVDQITDRLRLLPGVVAATPILYPPFLGANLMVTTPLVEGQSEEAARANPSVPLEVGGPEYFRTLGIPLRGRGFLDSDRENSTKVVVISDALARRFWPGQDAIGERLRIDGDSGEWRTVVGVAGDIRFRRLREPTPTIYLPWRQLITFGSFAVRTTSGLYQIVV